MVVAVMDMVVPVIMVVAVDGVPGTSTSDSPGPTGPPGSAVPPDVAAVVGVVVGVVAVHLKENSTMFRFCAVSRLIV